MSGQNATARVQSASRRRFLGTAAGVALGALTGWGTTSGAAAAVARSPTVYATTFDGRLHAVDAATGEERWESVGLETPPTVDDGTVYLSGALAVDAATGDREWVAQEATGGDSSVVGDTLYAGGQDGLAAFDRTTGERRWSFTAPADAVNGAPMVVDGLVIAGSRDGRLYAVTADGGESVWTYAGAQIRIDSSPTVVDGTVYVTSRDALHAVDAATGKREWVFDDVTVSRSSPTVHDGTVYVGTTAGELQAIDAATGERRWQFDEPRPRPMFSAPTVVDGTVYVGCHDRSLYAVDAETGAREWAFTEPSEGVNSSPTVYDGTVYVGCDDETLYAVDAETGQREWAFETADLVNGSPTVVADPESGHSVGSRVWLGTLGHHDEWRHADQKIGDGEPTTTKETTAEPSPSTATPSADATTPGSAPTSSPVTSPASRTATPAGDDADSEATTSGDSVPGFAAPTALAGLAGAGLLAWRRTEDDAE